ncbi:MAG: fasciclin domain-containing protein [Chloroflexota bacterium]
MLNKRFRRLMMSMLIMGVLASYPVASLLAASPAALPSQDILEAKTVTGSLPGGEFAKIWLAVDPDFPEAQIEVFVEWDRPNAAANGVGFFILDEVGLSRAQAGTSLQDISTASGNPVFEGADNQMEANFKAFGLTRYTMVVFNDSDSGAGFTATVENAAFIDDSNQVTDPTAPAVEVASEDEEGAEGAEGDAEEDGSESTAEETSAESAPEPTAVVTTAPVAAAAPATEEATEEAPNVAPAQAATTSVVREEELEGELVSAETHYIGLIPRERDGQIELQMVIEPQNITDLLRRVNFFVLRTEDLSQLDSNTRPSDIAIAAGNRVFGGAENERKANFQATGTGEYTILVTNTSGDRTAQYTLTVDNGTMVDDSGQTLTAQAAASPPVSEESASDDAGEEATETTADAEPVAAPAPAAAPATDTTTTSTAPDASTATAGTGDYAPGSTYIVQLNDTLGIIAREAFGDVLFYRQICAFNSIANCNVIEIGDEIQIPTLRQLEALGDNPTSVPVTEEPEPEATPEPTDDETDAETGTTANSTTNTSSTATSDADEEETSAASEEADASSTEETDAESTDLLATAKSQDGFNVLVLAIEAAGLEKVLQEPGGPLTVFAPTDAAFASLPDGVLDALLQDPGGQLTNVLLYHVVPGTLIASDLTDGDSIETVEGSEMTFNETSSGFNINNDANIIDTDIVASNGVIHVIDGVIQPVGGPAPSSDASEPASTDLQTVIENLPVLEDASDLSSESDEDAISVSYKTESTIDEAADFYKDEMERSGYEITRNVVTAAAGSLSFEIDDVTVQVGLTEDDDANVVTLTVTNQ